ncbi:MAG: hypothetical protein JWM11_5389 [Planctomycetaceae bacterium]|nr:hypothetical protein [Planctomycetaceae bacterium]
MVQSLNHWFISMSRHVRVQSLLLAVAVLAITIPASEAQTPAGRPVAHRIMICEYSGAAHRLVEISPEGKLTWEHPFPSIAVCFRMTAEGDVMFADGGKPTGVQKVNRDHKVVFDYRAACDQVLACDILANGNILVAEQGPCQAVEINPRGEIVATVKLSTTEKGAHRQLRCIHQLENGHILACHEAEGVVREYSRDGKSAWEYGNVTNVFEALRLSNGNTLIGCGTDKKVIEVTPDKKIVWELSSADAPDLNLNWITSLQVLRNGNVVVANFLRGQEGKGAHAFEVTRDQKKSVVWKFADHQLVKSITMVRVIED